MSRDVIILLVRRCIEKGKDMGIFSGFPFETKKDIDRRNREFDERMFPFGAEKQWEKTKEVLSVLVDEKHIKRDMIHFAYMSAKDRYTTYMEEGFGEEAAIKELDRVLKKKNEVKKLILTLIKLDTEIEAFEDYPTPERVREVAAQTE